MSRKRQREDAIDFALFGFGPLIGKYGWSITDYAFKILSWSLLVGALDVLNRKVDVAILKWVLFGGRFLLLLGVASLSYNLARYFEVRIRNIFGVAEEDRSVRDLVSRLVVMVLITGPVFIGVLMLSSMVVGEIWNAIQQT